MKYNFIDLAKQQARIRKNIDNGFKKVLDSGQYILGEDVKLCEQNLSDFCGAKYSVTCSSGTDALVMALMAHGIGNGDFVIVPSFTFAASAEVLYLVGARPIFVDVDPDTYNIDIESLKNAIYCAKKDGLNLVGIIGVDLFGLPFDFDAVSQIAKEENLLLIDDCAQGFGAKYKGKTVGSIGDISCTSFFPAKPLGCYGDGGAIFTDDEQIYEKLVSIRVHGQDNGDKYLNSVVGINGRMDTLQCVVINEKLKIFADEIEKRNNILKKYNELLSGVVKVPYIDPDYVSTVAQYTIQVDWEKRAKIQESLGKRGVPSVVYYKKGLHLQQAYKDGIVYDEGGLQVTENICNSVLSLPMHPYLEDSEIEDICDALKSAVK